MIVKKNHMILYATSVLSVCNFIAMMRVTIIKRKRGAALWSDAANSIVEFTSTLSAFPCIVP